MIETALFQGEVDITLDISQASDVIYLHQTNLTFTAITITQLKLEESPQITIPPEPLDALIGNNIFCLHKYPHSSIYTPRNI